MNRKKKMWKKLLEKLIKNSGEKSGKSRRKKLWKNFRKNCENYFGKNWKRFAGKKSTSSEKIAEMNYRKTCKKMSEKISFLSSQFILKWFPQFRL